MGWTDLSFKRQMFEFAVNTIYNWFHLLRQGVAFDKIKFLMSNNFVVALHVFLRFLNWGESVLEYIIKRLCTTCAIFASKIKVRLRGRQSWTIFYLDFNEMLKIQHIPIYVTLCIIFMDFNGQFLNYLFFYSSIRYSF